MFTSNFCCTGKLNVLASCRWFQSCQGEVNNQHYYSHDQSHGHNYDADIDCGQQFDFHFLLSVQRSHSYEDSEFGEYIFPNKEIKVNEVF